MLELMASRYWRTCQAPTSARSSISWPGPARRRRRAGAGCRCRRVTSGRSTAGSETAHGERTHDVAHAFHECPHAGEHEQRVRLLDEELAADPERNDEHQDPSNEANPPQPAVGLRDHGLDRPPDP